MCDDPNPEQHGHFIKCMLNMAAYMLLSETMYKAYTAYFLLHLLLVRCVPSETDNYVQTPRWRQPWTTSRIVIMYNYIQTLIYISSSQPCSPSKVRIAPYLAVESRSGATCERRCRQAARKKLLSLSLDMSQSIAAVSKGPRLYKMTTASILGSGCSVVTGKM